MGGPLKGVRVVEMAGIGPAPFCATLLADLGADVVRIDRQQAIDLGLPGRHDPRFEVLMRGRRALAIDVKSEDGREMVLQLIESADALIEGFRPGVMERLGLGPDVCQTRNRRLVFGRMTGWGQDGPLAPVAGHDINYIALSGMLHAIGPKDGQPLPPLNLIGDFGGGGMMLAFGVLAALLEARGSGRGQVVDVAMAEGAAYLGGMFWGLLAKGDWQERRGENLLDGGAPWYQTYRTRDDGYMAVGAIEARFYAALVERLGLGDAGLPAQHDRAGWPVLRARFAEVFQTRTRSEWESHFSGSDACVTPVLSLSEAPEHPHAKAREAFVTRGEVMQPGVVPKFSRTPGEVGAAAAASGSDSRAVLAAWGFQSAEIERLERAGVFGK